MLRLLFALPLIGGVFRELNDNPEQAFLPFIANIALVLAVLSYFFGPVIIMTVALLAAPAVLIWICLMCADFGRSI